MRELTRSELAAIAGAGDLECTPQDTGNNYGGVSDTGGFGEDLVNLYEGLVYAASHVIERVAKAL